MGRQNDRTGAQRFELGLFGINRRGQFDDLLFDVFRLLIITGGNFIL
jgi:hypothetical protein